MSRISSYFPLSLLLIFWLLFSSPFFLHNKVPYPADQLMNNYAPWSDYGINPGPVKNPALSDVITQLFPWKKLVIDTYRTGHLPLWNPYEFSGNPLAGNYQSAAFSPLNALFFLLPFVTAWSLLILLQPLIAGVGMYLFVTQLTKNKYAGVFSAICFMFSGFMTVWLEYGTLALSASMLPWVLLSLEKIQEKKRYRWIWLGAISLALSFLAGHFQTSLYVAGFTFVYALVFCWKNTQIRLAAAAIFALGVILALPQLLVTLGIFSHTVRSGDVFSDAGIPWWYLITVVVPDFFGNPTKGSEWVGHYAEWASFIGIVPLLFALFATKDKMHVRFFQIVSVASVLLALKTPLLNLVAISHFPVLSSSYPTRIIVLCSFSLCVLAGIGFVRVWEEQLERRRAFIVICSVTVLLVAFWVGGYIALPRDKAIISLRNLVYPSSYFVLTALMLGIAYQAKIPRLKQICLICCIGLAGLQGLFFSMQWNPFISADKVYPPVSIIQEIQKNLHGGRVYGTMSNAVYSYYHIPSIEGYDPLYSQRYSDFIRASDPNHNLGLSRSAIALDPHGQNLDRIFNLLGVSVLYHPKSHDFQPWAYPVWEKDKMWSQIYEDKAIRLYKNNDAMNLATLYCSYKSIPDEKVLLQTFYAKDFPYKETLLLSSQPEHRYGEYCREREGNVSVVKYASDELTITVQSAHPALLFISQNIFPTNIAYVNGKLARIYPADLAFMAIEVPGGHSVVRIKPGLF